MATCTATGAKKIRELLAILKLRAGQRRTKPRMGSRTTGVVAVEKRRKAYTPNPAVSAGQAAKRRVRDQPTRGANGRKKLFMENDAVSLDNAVRQLKDCGAKVVPKRCPSCGGALSADLHRACWNGKERAFYRCNAWDCRKRVYVMQLTPFKKMRLLPQQALAMLKEYARPDRIAAPGPGDLAARAGCGKQHAEQFVKLCRAAEAKLG